MRQKNSNLWLVIGVIVLIALVLFVASREVPLRQEQVEQTHIQMQFQMYIKIILMKEFLQEKEFMI
mgnify:CR=1 FL=1